jgi:hypothetical protein
VPTRIRTLLAALAAAACLAPAAPAWATASPYARLAVTLAADAQAALRAMQAAFYRPLSDDYLDEATVGQPTSSFAALWAPATAVWGASWAVAAVEDVAALPSGRPDLPLVRQVVDGLQAYWDAGASPPAYAPTEDPGPHAVKYFDDNAWVGLDLVEAWRLTHDPAYLYRAEAVLRYEESGWDAQGGGLWWSDARTYRNTAANAPAAELAVRLYLATGDRADLAFAERLAAWEWNTLVLPDGEVMDGIGPDNLPAEINPTQYTYNYGTVVAENVLLYRATGDRAYLLHAETVARYALAHLRQADGAWLPQARFNGVLADGLLLLLKQGGVPGLGQALVRNALLAWTHDRAPDGLFGKDWAGPPPTGRVALLTDTGAVRTLAVGAEAAALLARAADVRPAGPRRTPPSTRS